MAFPLSSYFLLPPMNSRMMVSSTVAGDILRRCFPCGGCEVGLGCTLLRSDCCIEACGVVGVGGSRRVVVVCQARSRSPATPPLSFCSKSFSFLPFFVADSPKPSYSSTDEVFLPSIIRRVSAHLLACRAFPEKSQRFPTLS